MKKSFKLFVDDPCHEDWDKMSPTEQGRFCNSCQKEVIDFSGLSDSTILKLIEQHTGKEVCGQFQPQQLNRTLYSGYVENSVFSLRAVLLGATITSLLSLESCGSSKKTVSGNMWVHESHERVGNSVRHEPGQLLDSTPLEIHISGSIVDAASGEGIGDVSISVLDENGKELISKKSRSSGAFSYTSHDGSNTSLVVFSKEGYRTIQFAPDQLPMEMGKIKIQMVKQSMIRGRISTGSNVKF